MRNPTHPALFAGGLLLVCWIAAALFAWPDHFDQLANPFVVSFVSFAVAGLVIVLRRPGHPVGWLLLAFGFLSSVGICGVLLASRWMAAGYPISAAWSDAVGYALMTPGIQAVPAVLILFPEGRIPGRRGRPLLWLVGAGALAGALAALLNGGWGGDIEQALVVSPLRASTAPLGDLMSSAFYLLLALSIIGGSVSLLIRWRVSRGLERQQIKWLAIAASLVVLALAVAGFNTQDLWEIVLVAAALSLIPVAIGIAILRYRLFEIDRIISRTVTYGLVVGMLGLVALGLVTLLTRFLPSDDPLVVAVATLAVAALFNPLRKRVQLLVDRRFNRARYDSQRVIDAFAEKLRDEMDPDAVVDGWVDVVEDTVQPTTVGVWVKESRNGYVSP